MSTPISIRRATEDDAQAIAGLAGDLGYTVDAQVMRMRVGAILASNTDLLVVAADASGECLAGCRRMLPTSSSPVFASRLQDLLFQGSFGGADWAAH